MTRFPLVFPLLSGHLSRHRPTHASTSTTRRLLGASLAWLVLGPSIAGAATLHGTVWNDANGSGGADPREPGVPGVTVYLDLNLNRAYDSGEPFTVTLADAPETTLDESGLYWLAVAAGSHIVRAVTPEDTEQTFPPDGYIVSVTSSETVSGLDFGFMPLGPGSIAGRIWKDLDQDGLVDPIEAGLGGVLVYSDINANCRYDRGEPAARSWQDDPLTVLDETGFYLIEDLEPGPHTVRLVQPTQHAPSFPTGAAHQVVVPNAGPTGSWNFGLDDLTNFTTTSPARLDLVAPVGETVDAIAALSIAPFCIRPFDLDAVASDPNAPVENLSGVLTNGCGGSSSVFALRFTATAERQCYQLEIVDADFGSVLGSLPVTVVPEPGVGLALLAGSFGLLASERRRLRKPRATDPARDHAWHPRD